MPNARPPSPTDCTPLLRSVPCVLPSGGCLPHTQLSSRLPTSILALLTLHAHGLFIVTGRHPRSVPAGLGSSTHLDPGLWALADSVPWAPPSSPVCPPCRPSWLSASTPSCRRTPARAPSSELQV